MSALLETHVVPLMEGSSSGMGNPTKRKLKKKFGSSALNPLQQTLALISGASLKFAVFLKIQCGEKGARHSNSPFNRNTKQLHLYDPNSCYLAASNTTNSEHLHHKIWVSESAET